MMQISLKYNIYNIKYSEAYEVLKQAIYYQKKQPPNCHFTDFWGGVRFKIKANQAL